MVSRLLKAILTSEEKVDKRHLIHLGQVITALKDAVPPPSFISHQLTK